MVAVMVVIEDHGLGGTSGVVSQAGRRNVGTLLQCAPPQRVWSGRSPTRWIEGDEPHTEQTFRSAGREHQPQLRAAPA